MWGRSIVTGVHLYSQRRGNWHLFVEARGRNEFSKLPKDWNGDGIIARIDRPKMARELAAFGAPVVNVSGIALPDCSLPRVTVNVRSAVRLAAEHLLNAGLRNFGYFSLLPQQYIALQEAAFSEIIEQAGHPCATLRAQIPGRSAGNWIVDSQALARWLLCLPKPVGIFTWDASSGRHLIHACEEAGLRVPDQVAVLSGSEDDLLCEVSNVPMSGVDVSAEQIGFEAAQMLDTLMRSQPLRQRTILLEPLGVVARESTDTVAIADSAAADAVRFIRDHSAAPIQVDDVVAATGVSRRSLERRFQEHLGRTIAHEIRRMHLERARQLLVETHLPIPEVAQASGFTSAQYMIYTFQKVLNESPLRYRKRMQNV